MKISLLSWFAVGILFVSGASLAQTVNEGDLFSSSETVEAVKIKEDASVSELVTQESVAFSGEIASNFGYNLTRAYLDGDGTLGDNPYMTAVQGDLLLDVRLRKGIKAFADLNVNYSPKDDPNNPNADHLQYTAKEFFTDVNIAHRVYFRFGKQTLKWGQGYFWNPTDVISVDRKDFKDINARRTGVYGLKTHVPFGTRLNVYSFLNASSANRADEFAVAGKIEALLPYTIEVAASAWAKQHYPAVYGLDFRASPTNKMQVWGELSLSYGDHRSRLEQCGDRNVATRVTNAWIPRFSLGMSRTFNQGDLPDRITVAGEVYYNDGGYDKNMLQDTTRDQFLSGGYFEANNYGKTYAALFTSIDRFLMRDLTVELNAISNLSDASGTFLTGFVYQLANNAELDAHLIKYWGRQNREFTLSGNSFNANVSLMLTF